VAEVVQSSPITIPSPDGQRDLFDHALETPAEPDDARAPVDAETWARRLLACAVWMAQKQLVQKHLPDDATVLRVLGALDRHGGTLTFAALAQQAGVLPLRLDGLLAKLQRLLNVDGYEVLQVDRTQNRVSLNAPLLRRQFELE
jgi:hypothetical protein